uniref:Uncharacterized protein n=1 Tax=Heliothis virescens TaxID=7102 RepID=A0A2A4JKN6_HELVI
MQIISILLSLTLVSIAQAGLSTRIPKPKWNWHSQNTKTQEFSKHKSPEERRKLSIFPKSYMKYVISSEPIYKIATHKPFVHKAKKPLMKKFNLLDKSSASNENEPKQPNIHGKVIYDNSEDGTPRVESVVFSEEVSIEIIEDKSEESNEIDIDQMKETILQNDEKEMKVTGDTSENKDVLSLKDVIFPPEINMPVEVNSEDKTNNSALDVPAAPANPEEAGIPDTVEFIFIDPAQKTKDSASISSEEDYITTEMYAPPELFRRKRGSNIIEEENLASTVTGYKYTWKDTRLDNESVFKNIHS